MQLSKQKDIHTCAEQKKLQKRDWKWGWLKYLFPVAGLASLVWFLIRVIPKPSRAFYPCQRVAFPLASGFVIWLTGSIASVVAFRKAKLSFARRRYILGLLCVVLSVVALWMAVSMTNEKSALAEPPL